MATPACARASPGSVVAAARKRSSAWASQPSRPSTARSYVSSASLDPVVTGRPYASARTDGMLEGAPALGERRAQEFDRAALRPRGDAPRPAPLDEARMAAPR